MELMQNIPYTVVRIHQPFSLKPYGSKEIDACHTYDDPVANERIINELADRTFLPSNAEMLSDIHKSGYTKKIRYSISGTTIELLQQFRPDVIDSFRDLVETGCIEFFAETYYHSLSEAYSKKEFSRQIQLHADLVRDTFGVKTIAKLHPHPSGYKLNTEQHTLINKLYGLENLIDHSRDEKLIRNWRMLQASDYIFDTSIQSYYKNMITDLEITLIREQIRITRRDLIPLTHNYY
jgi:hypothetical protein